MPISFYICAKRALPCFCPGSFNSVRLMLSICHSKFAPILWHENTHLFLLSFCVRIFLFSLFIAVLDNRLLLLLSFRILRYSSIELSRDLRGMIRLFRKRAVSLDLAIATRLPVPVRVPAFPYIALYHIRMAAAYRKTIKREKLTGKALFALNINVQLDLRRVMIC